MKYYYLNKIAMAVLVALLLFFGTRTIIDIAYQEHPPEKPGMEVAVDETATDEKPAEEEPGASETIAFLATADPAQGEADAGLCKVCHSFDQGGPTMIGPNLYNTVGHKIAGHEGFNYSPALKGKDGEWTYENLDAWLASPQTFAPGTSMAFPGIPDPKKRADMIAFLRAKTDNPPPLPEVAPAAEEPAAEEPEAEEPAEEEPAAEEPTEEEPAAEEPTAEEPAAAEPEAEESAAEEPAAEEPAAATEEEATEETIVVPPTVSEDAPSEPHQGEAPSPNQPQPVVPEDTPEVETPDMDEDSSESMSEDSAPSSQPQPVYPDGPPDGL
jgi:cytochrome c2